MRTRLALAALAVAVLGAASLLVAGAPAENHRPRLSLVRDWSSRHLVYSQPRTLMQAFRLSREPRYIQQWIDREGRRSLPGPYRHLIPSDSVHRDWSQSLGASGATVGQNQYPAKFSFDVNATPDCTNDFVVFNTDKGTTSQAGVIAYNNLYSGCGGSVPSVLWAYYTGGSPATSVELSLDGTQIAFVQDTASSAQLVVLKWASSDSETVTSPMNLTGAGTNVSNADYPSCTAPCMTTISVTGVQDLSSAVFIDYAGDTAYFGDASGNLYQVTGVFTGTPTLSGSPWPIKVASNLETSNTLRSPVYDSVTGNVFVTDGMGEHLYAVCTNGNCAGDSNGSVTVSVGTVTASGALGGLGACYGGGLGSPAAIPSPVVDSAAGTVYVGTGGDGTDMAALIQFSTTVSSTNFSQGGCGNAEAKIGSGGGDQAVVFAGAFDNLYLTSGPSSSPTGNYYVCGNSSGHPALYQVPITNNSMGTPTEMMALSSSVSAFCSAVTEIYNNGTDWLFMSVTTAGVSSGCSSGGCVFSVSAPTTLGGSLPSSPSAALAASGGASGIIIDNSDNGVTISGTSQIYYGTLSGDTAVQASQSGLE